MSKLKIVAIFLILIVAVMTTSQIYLAKSTREMENAVSNIQTSYRQSGNSAETQKRIRSFRSLWQKNSRILPTMIKHSEIDIVNTSVAKLPAYLQGKESVEFNAECDLLKMQLIHLWDIEKIDWENIL